MLTAPRLLGLIAALVLGASTAAQAKEPTPLEIDADSFSCIRDMTPVRGFYVDSLTGDIEATLAAANAPNGSAYPAGSVVQLVPGEVMVKHASGTSPATKDWEFFELDTSAEGTSIRKRGYADGRRRITVRQVAPSRSRVALDGSGISAR